MDFVTKNSLTIIKALATSHPAMAVFVIAIIFGEPGVLFLSFLSARHVFPITLVVAMAYTSAIIAEILWFLIGRSRIFHYIEKWIVRTGISEAFTRFTKHIDPQHPFKTLLVTRFISGLTVPIIVYLSRKGTSLKTFTLNSLIINLIWTPMVVAIGWFAGQGFTLLLKTFENVEFAITIFIAIGVVVLIAEKKLKSRYIINKK